MAKRKEPGAEAEPPGKTGRKPLLWQPLPPKEEGGKEETRAARIIKLVSRGVSQRGAAAESGIDSRTLEKWIRWGSATESQEIQGAPPFAEREPYRDFVAKLAIARDARESRWVQVIDLAALKGDVHAAQWLLRTQFPETHGDKIAVQLKNGVDHVLEVAERVLERTQFARLCEALAGDSGGQEAPPPPTGGPAEGPEGSKSIH